MSEMMCNQCGQVLASPMTQHGYEACLAHALEVTGRICGEIDGHAELGRPEALAVATVWQAYQQQQATIDTLTAQVAALTVALTTIRDSHDLYDEPVKDGTGFVKCLRCHGVWFNGTKEQHDPECAFVIARAALATTDTEAVATYRAGQRVLKPGWVAGVLADATDKSQVEWTPKGVESAIIAALTQEVQ